jgi:allantoicase
MDGEFPLSDGLSSEDALVLLLDRTGIRPLVEGHERVEKPSVFGHCGKPMIRSLYRLAGFVDGFDAYRSRLEGYCDWDSIPARNTVYRWAKTDQERRVIDYTIYPDRGIVMFYVYTCGVVSFQCRRESVIYDWDKMNRTILSCLAHAQNIIDRRREIERAFA